MENLHETTCVAAAEVVKGEVVAGNFAYIHRCECPYGPASSVDITGR